MKIDEIKNSLKNLEESIERAIAFIESSVEAMRQEIAFINQKVSDLESRLDRLEGWPHIGEAVLGEEGARRQGRSLESEASSCEAAEEHAPLSKAPRGNAPSGRGGGAPLTRAPVDMREQLLPRSPAVVVQLGDAPSVKAAMSGEKLRGGIVEEQFIRPSDFLRRVGELEASTHHSTLGSATPQTNLRLQISSVLESMRGARSSPTQPRVRAPSAVQPTITARSFIESSEKASPTITQPAETRSVRVPDNWLPDCSRAKYYNPKKLDKSILKDMEKKTKEIFVR